MARVFVSIGSNLGDTLGNITGAIGLILETEGVSPSGVGSFYETEPVGKTDQPWFLNTAIAIETDLPPDKLLERFQEIEIKLGRMSDGEGESVEKWFPRPIDIDIIFYGDKIVETKNLKIPHPEAARRRFVLTPIADIDGDLIHPALKLSVADLLSAIPEDGQVMRKTGP